MAGKVVNILGRRIHSDYIPTIRYLMGIKSRSPDETYAKDIIAGAFYKIEKDECLFLTDTRSPVLQRIYGQNKQKSDFTARGLIELNKKMFDISPNQFATVLSGAFEAVFEKTFGAWRKSLEERVKIKG